MTKTIRVDSLESHVELIKSELQQSLQQAADEIIPDFIGGMPDDYFERMDRATQLFHARALVMAAASGLSQDLLFRSDNGRQYTLVTKNNTPGQLYDVLQRLPRDRPLQTAHLYTASKGDFLIDVFDFGEPDRDARQRVGEGGKHQVLLEAVVESSYSQVVVEEDNDESATTLVLGFQNISRRRVFERIARYLGHLHIDIRHAHLETFQAEEGRSASLLYLVVARGNGGAIDGDSELVSKLKENLKRLCVLDDSALELFYQEKELSLLESELICALARLCHQSLVSIDRVRFSTERIMQRIHQRAAIVRGILEAFHLRFGPDADSKRYREAHQLLVSRITRSGLDVDDRKVLEQILGIVDAILKTNAYVPQRNAISFRLNAEILCGSGREQIPYGVFYICGRAFDAFQVRFRDISRGGMRIVLPGGLEQYTRENERLFDEVYGLAYAQQLKNKDIPEGGSKAVLLVKPGHTAERCARSCVDALLDLITEEDEVRSYIVDYLEEQELIYLGPDENVSGALINWIVARASKRKYPLASAFMSSKPGAGINHKEFGVTSEGVSVFLEAALRAKGIDPRTTPFTIKITGGPDGDVAGNQLKILNREFGTNARVVGIADGTACVEDPAGLDINELLRLVEAEAGIVEFDQELLSEAGQKYLLDTREGRVARNTMHNRVIADAFVPAGGRPRTINEDNWREFLTVEGKPSSAVIVEGANLFLTDEARAKLSEIGVAIVKDSSANKCGVICSSLEVLASMLLTVEKFLEMKESFVEEVMLRLRHFAKQEAEVLFREHLHKPQVSLPELSVRLSGTITMVTDAVLSSLDSVSPETEKLCFGLIRQYVPASLRASLGKDVVSILPTPYLKRTVATILAGTIVYREGLDFFEHMPATSIARVALRYLEQEETTRDLLAQIGSSNMAGKDMISSIVERSGSAILLRSQFAGK